MSALNLSPLAGRSLVRTAGSFMARYGLGLLLVAVWQVAAVRAQSIFFPPPSEIFGRAIDLWFSGPAHQLFLTPSVLEDIVPSILRVLGGWTLAVLVGVPLGILIGLSKGIADFLNPPLQFLRAIPGPALIPVLIILLGTDSTMRVTLIAFGAVWPTLLNTIEGVITVDKVQLDTARAFRLPLQARLVRVVLPAAMPKIFAGMRVSLSLAVILMAVSEFVASTSGIGHVIQHSQIMFLLTDMWCGIVLLGLLGFSLNWLLLKIEDRALAWHKGARGRAGVS